MTGDGGSEISADSQTSIEKIVPSMNTPGSSINTRWLDPSRDLNVRESLSETTAPITNNFQINDTATLWGVDYGQASSFSCSTTSFFYEFNATVKSLSIHSFVLVEDSQLALYGSLADNLSAAFEAIWSSEVPYFGVPPDVDGNGRVV